MVDLLEVIANDDNKIGEGPIWDEKQQRLLWTDITSSLVYQLDRAGNKTIINRDLVVNGIGLNHDGRLVFSGAGGLFLWSAEGQHECIVSTYDGEHLSFNDMVVGPLGRVYAGTMYWGENGKEKNGKLYMIDAYADVKIVAEGISQALLTTAFGLVVAVVLQILQNTVLYIIDNKVVSMQKAVNLLLGSIEKLKK